MLVKDRAEIGTLECRLSSIIYGYPLNRAQELNALHIIFKSQDGTGHPSNLITLREDCHQAWHRGEFELKTQRPKTKHTTKIGIIKSALAKQILEFPKSHYHDPIAICYEDSKLLSALDKVLIKKHVRKDDYRLPANPRSEKKISAGKLFGLRKCDLLKTEQGISFVPGKASSGCFALMDINGSKITASLNLKKNIVRLAARTTTLTQLREAANPLSLKWPSFLAEN